jgi:hypothetical protein
MIEAWIPSIVSVGALGMIWAGIRTRDQKMKDKLDEMKRDQTQFLTESKHDLLCQNSSLQVEKHVTHEITLLKDEMFKELRDIKVLVKNGNGKKDAQA